MTDARILRTRAALHTAIIDLSSEKQIIDITVSELADHAGINRVTFYKHYNTPAETLAEALNSELRGSAGAAPDVALDRAAVMQSVYHVLDHIEAHRELYLLAFRTHVDGTVPVMLAKHFAENFYAYLTKRRKKKPAVPDIDLDVAASYLASATTGAISVWLLEGDMSRERFFENLDRLLPAWFFTDAAVN